MKGTVLKIWQSKKILNENKAAPGTVVNIEDDGIVIATGNETAIKITELQPSGKKRMSAEQYLRGAASDLTTGTILGE